MTLNGGTLRGQIIGTNQWEQTKPVSITLVKGKHLLRATLPDGSCGETIKGF